MVYWFWWGKGVFYALKSISFDILSRYKQHDLFKLRNASTGLPSYPDLYIIQIVMDSGYWLKNKPCFVSKSIIVLKLYCYSISVLQLTVITLSRHSTISKNKIIGC